VKNVLDTKGNNLMKTLRMKF